MTDQSHDNDFVIFQKSTVGYDMIASVYEYKWAAAIALALNANGESVDFATLHEWAHLEQPGRLAAPPVKAVWRLTIQREGSNEPPFLEADYPSQLEAMAGLFDAAMRVNGEVKPNTGNPSKYLIVTDKATDTAIIDRVEVPA